MKENNENIPPIDKRFIISPDSMKMLKEARAVFVDLKKQIPELAGMTFFGSRTLGREKSVSDVDCFLFLNFNEEEIIEPFYKRLLISNILQHTQQRLESIKPDLYSIVDVIDISKTNTDQAIADFIKLVLDQNNAKKDFTRDNSTMPHQEAASLLVRFLLGFGEDLYKNRIYILDQLAKEENSNELWQKIVDYVSYVERTAETKKRKGLPSYEKYPRTIEEAKRYFINRELA